MPYLICCPPPGPPFYGGRQSGGLGSLCKGAGGQWIGFWSITAAAESRVTFGRCFSWWGARLLDWWSSILAQWDGGRVLDPPLWSGKGVYLCIGTGHFRAQAPGGPVCRPYKIRGTLRSFRRGRSQTGPRAAKGRPYGGKRPGSVGSANPGAEAEPHQSQFSSRPGPSGPDETAPKHSCFARRKFSAHFKG